MTNAVLPLMLFPILVAICASYLVVSALLWLGARHLERPILWQWGRLLAVGSVGTVLIVAGANVLWVALAVPRFERLVKVLSPIIFYSFPLQLLGPPLYAFLAYRVSKCREAQKPDRPPKEGKKNRTSN